MKIALVILNWNGKELLEKFLPSILKYSDLPEVEIVVADNDSTDASIAFVRDSFPSVTIIQNTENHGFAKGYNDALKYVNADIYGLLNSDIEVTENWLEPIIEKFKKDKETAIVQPKICDYNKKHMFEYAGAGGGFIDSLGYPYCRGRVFSAIEEDTGQYNDSCEVFWASGACFFIRANVYKSLHGFDEHYFAHQEEIDLCWRTQHLGYKVSYTGTSVVYHVGAATLKASNPRKTFLNFRNSLYSLVKNLPKSKLFPVLFSRLCLDGVAGLKFLLELQPVHTMAIIKAHFSFYRHFKTMLKKRSDIQKQTKYYEVSSIVWNYFILNKKRYNNQINREL